MNQPRHPESDDTEKTPHPTDAEEVKHPKPGTDEARNEERKTQPSRNRGVTDI
ncbi:hypothetical protein GN316_11130 [Xylophilus sp. Kf1]|nr:hypothetical protein [Xylophilus sp. Kf1]